MNSKLAIHGGKPVREHYLPYGRQTINEDDIQAVVNVLNSEYLTTGPIVNKFENEIAKYVGAKYAVAFSNGTAALHGACFAAGISEGDEVITSPITFAASANCILYQGGTPIFADIDPETYNIDPDSIKEKVTDRTKAIIPVHFTGQPAAMDEILKIAREHELIVIEDAAHALGAVYKDKKIGPIGDMTMFSFHPVKHITTGEGGIITTDNEEYYRKLLQFRTHGITRDPMILRDNHQGPWYYEMHFLGFNYRITDIQAALGLSQLSKLDNFIKQRKKYAGMYNEQLKELSAVILPKQMGEAESSWHLFVIRLKLPLLRCNRKELFKAIQAENIGINVHYIPVYTLPYYQKLGYNAGICPKAEKLYEEIITLPLFPGMTEPDVMDVIRSVKKVINFYSL
ncbi:UDP-4-amino-4,6-dideoxy-N-acetyl-beta-L-altrosamine transaminase [Cytobacillus sp. FSL R5-0596]|uniref:UDP-4-amino-4, 6-dideoxy-N-acetyl-beta-L-altrosamine transaminase n=1 Tax=Cytobacillus sp. FSL R5-0596 TaxID=2954696 RepID=UPI0030F5AC4B